MKLKVELKASCCGDEMNRRNVIDVDSKKRSTILECKKCMKSIELEGINLTLK